MNQPTLAERIKAGDEHALSTLIESHKEEVCLTIGAQLRRLNYVVRKRTIASRVFHSQIESVFNDTLASLIRRIQAGKMLEDKDLIRYMVTISRNLLLNRKRKETRRRSVGDKPLAALGDANAPTNTAVEERELVAKCQTILSQLPQRHQRLISLRLEGLSFNDIGKQLNMSEGRARAMYHRCLAKLHRLSESGNT